MLLTPQILYKKRYIPLVWDDGGRDLAGFRNEARDCVVRAVAIGGQIPYKDAHDLLTWHGRKARRGTFYTHELLNNFFPGCLMIATCGPMSLLTIGQFIQEYPQGRYIVSIRGHALTIINGIAYDMSETGLRNKVRASWRMEG